jgi:hypothetical protein
MKALNSNPSIIAKKKEKRKKEMDERVQKLCRAGPWKF